MGVEELKPASNDYLQRWAVSKPRTYAVLLDALNRYRGKGGQQKVTVEHVDVHADSGAMRESAQLRTPAKGFCPVRKARVHG
jgi:hypothetical protein